MKKFESVDISAILLVGFSTRRVRLLMAVLSILLLLIVDVVVLKLFTQFPDGATSDLIAAVILVFFLLHYVHSGTFILKTWAIKTVDLTPFKVLYRADKLILEKAVKEIIRIANTISFEGCELYKKLNAAVSLETNQMVIEQINAETFQNYLEIPANLKSVSELIYQCYLAEETYKNENLFLE